MGCHPPRSPARPRCPGFNSHSALFSHPSVRSTLPSVLATMRRRRRRDDDKRGARIIELPCPALPLPPPRHRCLFRSRATREFLPLLPKTFRRQTDRLESTPVSPEVTSLVPLSSKKRMPLDWSPTWSLSESGFGLVELQDLDMCALVSFPNRGQKKSCHSGAGGCRTAAGDDGRTTRTNRQRGKRDIFPSLSHLRREDGFARSLASAWVSRVADAPPSLSPSLRPPIPIRL